MPELEWLRKAYPDFRISELRGPRITLSDIKPYLEMFTRSDKVRMSTIGSSIQGRPIHRLDIGFGDRVVLGWTQMHGNEATSTLALLDFLNWVTSSAGKEWFDQVFHKCKLSIIPILNPDGAERFERRNAVGIDINRDFISRSAPETRVFHEALSVIDPVLALNLHDQRTIFGDLEGRPATISFLSPSANPQKTPTKATEYSKGLIGAIAKKIEPILDFSLTRYTDEFYPGAFGDNLQRRGIPTILIESGAYPNDLRRYKAREFNFLILAITCELIAHGFEPKDTDIATYEKIPFNLQNRLDIVVKDLYLGQGCVADVGLLRQWIFDRGELKGKWAVSEIGDLASRFSEETIPGEQFRLTSGRIQIGETIEFTKVNNHV